MVAAQSALERELRFVDGVVAGKTLAQAAIDAGYSARSAHVQASQIAKRPSVKQLIEAKRAKLAKRREISLDKIQEEMASIAYAKITDYISFTKDGDPYYDLTKIDQFQAGAISALDIEEYTDGRGPDARDVKKIKLKLHDKQAALMNLAKLCGFIGKDSTMIDVTPDPDAQDMRELARRMVFVMQQGIGQAATALPKQASGQPVTIENEDGPEHGSEEKSDDK